MFRDNPALRERFVFRHYDDPRLYLDQYLLENSYTGTYAAGKWKTPHPQGSTPRQMGAAGYAQHLLGVCGCRKEYRWQERPPNRHGGRGVVLSEDAKQNPSKTVNIESKAVNNEQTWFSPLQRKATESDMWKAHVPRTMCEQCMVPEQHQLKPQERANNKVEASQFFAELSVKIREALINKEAQTTNRHLAKPTASRLSNEVSQRNSLSYTHNPAEQKRLNVESQPAAAVPSQHEVLQQANKPLSYQTGAGKVQASAAQAHSLQRRHI